MTTITLFTALLLILLFSVVFYFVGQYMSNQKNKILQTKMGEVQAAHDELKNQVKKGKKQINQLSSQSESWKAKFEKTESKYAPQLKKAEAELAELKATYQGSDKQIDVLKVERDRLDHKLEKLKREHEKLKERYKVDLGDSKDWKNKRDSLTREAVSFKSKYIRAENDIKVLNERLQKEKNTNIEANEIKSKFRILQSNVRKLTKDVEYWEKKHYDAHHELATHKTKIETLEKGNLELDQLYKGSKIVEQNMLKKIEEFKTKFVNVNNEYHELKAKMEV